MPQTREHVADLDRKNDKLDKHERFVVPYFDDGDELSQKADENGQPNSELERT